MKDLTDDWWLMTHQWFWYRFICWWHPYLLQCSVQRLTFSSGNKNSSRPYVIAHNNNNNNNFIYIASFKTNFVTSKTVAIDVAIKQTNKVLNTDKNTIKVITNVKCYEKKIYDESERGLPSQRICSPSWRVGLGISVPSSQCAVCGSKSSRSVRGTHSSPSNSE